MIFLYIFFVAQILLESFPVSSSGHIYLLKYFLPDHASYLFSVLLTNMLHGPTALVLSFFFRSRWFFLLKNINRCWRIIIKIIFLTCLADCMTVLFFLFFKFSGTRFFPRSIGFVITALLLFSLCLHKYRLPKIWCWRYAIILGIVQGIALLPGISRFASTLVVAQWLGLPPRKAFEIAWLIEWPLIVAASTSSLYFLWNNNLGNDFLQYDLLVVVIIAMVGALYGLYIVQYLVDKNKLWLFAFYMLAPIVVSLYIS